MENICDSNFIKSLWTQIIMSGFDWESYVPGETTIFVMEGGVPYKCKVLSVTEETMKIHYVGFNKRYDEWVPIDSPRIVNEDAVSNSVLVDPVGAHCAV